MLTDEIKLEIDNMSYEQMLSIWRFAKSGHRLITGEVGTYFSSNMKEKKAKISNADQVQISKNIGWQ